MNDQQVSKPLLRSRLRYALLGVMVALSGLLWRSGVLSVPPFLLKYGGDALWALGVFVGFGLLFNRLSTVKIAAIAMIFSVLIEFSQLYHAPWIDSIRSTRLGALILGSVFNWPDLVAYAAGVAIGSIAEIIHHLRQQNSQVPVSDKGP